jgi:hypothetical protein
MVDVVGLNQHTDTLLLGECKWTSAPIGRAVFDNLTALESDVRWHGDDRTVNYVLFSRAGFTEVRGESPALQGGDESDKQ